MSRKLTQKEYSKIECLVERITEAYSQKEVGSDIKQLEFLSNTLDVYSNISYMLSELVGYSTEAAKRKTFSEKNHWVSAAKSALYKLKSYGLESEGIAND